MRKVSRRLGEYMTEVSISARARSAAERGAERVGLSVAEFVSEAIVAKSWADLRAEHHRLCAERRARENGPGEGT